MMGWFNGLRLIGPTLWHWENSRDASSKSIELSLESLKTLAEDIGFELAVDFSLNEIISLTYYSTF
jgi:hypothetical protein